MQVKSHVTVNGAPLREYVDKEKTTEIEDVRREAIADVSRLRNTMTSAKLGRVSQKADFTTVRNSLMSILTERGQEWTRLDELRKHPMLSHLSAQQINSQLYKVSLKIRLDRKRVGYQSSGGAFVRISLDQTPKLSKVKPQPTHEEIEAAIPVAIPAAKPKVTLKANTIRAELWAIAAAMGKLEQRRANYISKLAAAHPGVGYLRILARLEKGHANLWWQLMNRLTDAEVVKNSA